MYLISYDISSTRLRTKVAKKLQDYGKRIQYSVFECEIGGKRYETLYRELCTIVDGAENVNIRIYHLGNDEEKKTVTIGDPEFVSSPDQQWDDLVIV